MYQGLNHLLRGPLLSGRLEFLSDHFGRSSHLPTRRAPLWKHSYDSALTDSMR